MIGDVTCDVAVVGAGGAGRRCALYCAEAGLDVCLIDENSDGAPDRRAWLRLQQNGSPDVGALTRAGLRVLYRSTVWTALAMDELPTGGEGFWLSAMHAGRDTAIEARAVVDATGMGVRVVPFDGWTLPGVFDFDDAFCAGTALPDGPIVVAGAGLAIYAAAAHLIRAGAPVTAVIDLDSGDASRARRGALRAAPEALRTAVGWGRAIRAAGVEVVLGATVRAARGESALEAVVVEPVDREARARVEPERSIAAGSLLVSHGFMPGGNLAALLGASRRYDLEFGAPALNLDERSRTSVRGLYAVGGAARAYSVGVGDAALCAATVTGDLGLSGAEPTVEAGMRERVRHAPAVKALRDAQRLRTALISAIPATTTICIYEGVTRGDVDAAVDDGASDVSQLKHYTRLGMGPCRGRQCGEIAAHLMAQKLGKPRAAMGLLTPRPPLRAVTLGDLVGEFSYADIPIPAPAPL
ncbi:MAG: FAD-dependent oxidoreductase [Pseudomonadota bacterium]